jgi:peptidoglycan/LPS O-acetylase OafA/YrhL
VVEGDISYGVYLIHGPVFQLGILSNMIWPTYASLGMVWMVVYALALLSERLIERPAMAFGKRSSRAIENLPESDRLTWCGDISGNPQAPSSRA